MALNEQFMVASIAAGPTHASAHSSKHRSPEDSNRILRVLMRRLNFSKTFGENMIFMLNRAGSLCKSHFWDPPELLIGRTIARRPLHAALDIENIIFIIYDEGNLGVFLYE